MSRYDHYERLCWLLIQFYPIQKKIIRWKRNCFLITDSSKGDWFSTSTSLLPGRRLKKERRWRWKGVNLLKHYLLLQQILWLSISNSKSLRLLHLRQNESLKPNIQHKRQKNILITFFYLNVYPHFPSFCFKNSFYIRFIKYLYLFCACVL